MDVAQLSRKLGTQQEWLRETFAEIIGTFLLVFLGNCSVAELVFSRQFGDPRLVTSVHLAYGLAVTMGILASGGGSGAHLNPAVTLAQAIVGKFPWRKMFHYFFGQYVGAFIAAACTYWIYIDALNKFDGGVRLVEGDKATAGIWTTYPPEYVGLWGGFVDQFLGTFVLLLVISAITDPKNMEVHKSLYALYVGLLVMVIGLSMSSNAGYALNPARDLSPRLFITMSGWGTHAFTWKNYWWVPIVGPHLGAIFGVLIYVFMIEVHHGKPRSAGVHDIPNRVAISPK